MNANIFTDIMTTFTAFAANLADVINRTVN